MATDKKRVQISMTEEIASKFDELTEIRAVCCFNQRRL